MRTLPTILTSVVLVATGVSAAAQSDADNAAGNYEGWALFDTLDRDNDGALNKQEVKTAGLSDRMDELDDDGNGVISKQELKDFKIPPESS